MRQRNHQIVGIHGAEFRFTKVEEFVDVRHFSPHRLLNVERWLDEEESDATENRQHHRQRDNAPMMAYHKAPELLKPIANITLKALRHVDGWFSIFAKRQQKGSDEKAG